ncbi:MAG: hypothetical protein CBB97_00560 [Candidatus Endolissoclinum sp. TMED37]|nr:MAG: hypothetical protein CBB97_00560 [Candidatus Endolissoclinum sp. TMED37]|tara:strand:+ start:2906 stop:5020 length:2115 start_codon:yes stop_codon:yes gene_type:complete
MIEAKLESNSANGAVEVFNFFDGLDETLYVEETTPYRITVKSDSDEISVYLGHLQLSGYRVEEFIYFSLEFEQLNDAITFKFFGSIFCNLIGRSEFIFETDEGVFAFDVEIESTKTNKDEVQAWMNSISQAFPIYYSPKSLSPISHLPANIEEKANFASLYSLLKETEELVEKVTKKSKSGSYLKRKFFRNTIDNGGNEIFDYAKPHNWFADNRRWGISSSRNDGQIKVNNVYFEPYNLPKTVGRNSYNTDLNRLLLSSLSSLHISLKIYSKIIIENMGEFHELRTQFRTTRSKFQIGFRLQQSISNTAGKIEKLLGFLSELQIEPINQPRAPVGDRRYEALISDISTINRLNLTYRKYAEKGEEKLGILGLDKIFEMFCYAEVVNSLIDIGFEIVDMDEENTINQYLSLWNQEKKLGLRILYDAYVPKSDDDTSGYPIVDYFKFGERKRPDFLLHFYNDEHEKIAILDAKYKSTEKCIKDFKKFNAENLLVKYGTKFFSKSEQYLPPFFIGAICLNNDAEKQCESTLLVSERGNSFALAPYQEVSIVELHSSDKSSLENTLKHLIQKFESYPLHPNPENIIDTSKPVIGLTKGLRKFGPKIDIRKSNISIVKLGSENPIFRNRSTRAPTLSNNDAAQIKGMLLRGDKPQDIAFWFGVNNGRISEIKGGVNFNYVAPAPPEKLPRKGPYPAVREFLEVSEKKDR